MQTSHVLRKKNFGFFENHSASTRTRGRSVKPERKFCGQGEKGGVNFSRFCVDVHYGLPLIFFRVFFQYPLFSFQVQMKSVHSFYFYAKCIPKALQYNKHIIISFLLIFVQNVSISIICTKDEVIIQCALSGKSIY